MVLLVLPLVILGAQAEAQDPKPQVLPRIVVTAPASGQKTWLEPVAPETSENRITAGQLGPLSGTLANAAAADASSTAALMRTAAENSVIRSHLTQAFSLITRGRGMTFDGEITEKIVQKIRLYSVTPMGNGGFFTYSDRFDQTLFKLFGRESAEKIISIAGRLNHVRIEGALAGQGMKNLLAYNKASKSGVSMRAIRDAQWNAQYENAIVDEILRRGGPELMESLRAGASPELRKAMAFGAARANLQQAVLRSGGQVAAPLSRAAKFGQAFRVLGLAAPFIEGGITAAASDPQVDGSRFDTFADVSMQAASWPLSMVVRIPTRHKLAQDIDKVFRNSPDTWYGQQLLKEDARKAANTRASAAP